MEGGKPIMLVIHLGSGADYLTLSVSGRVRPDGEGPWSSNWLHCIADVSAGAFRGRIEWQLRNEDLTRFIQALDRLGGQAGEALLDTLDGWLDVRVIRDEQGQIEARCQLVDNPVGGNTLEFRLILDENCISVLDRQLREVLEQFPVVGK